MHKKRLKSRTKRETILENIDKTDKFHYLDVRVGPQKLRRDFQNLAGSS
jgi:hypothetical protein